MRRHRAVLLALGALAIGAPVGAAAPAPHFEPNRGQLSPEVRFFARGPDYDLFLTRDEAVFSLRRGESDRSRDVVRMRLVGANPEPAFSPQDPLPGKSHYLRGPDPGGWTRDVPHYARVLLEEAYAGVSMAYRGNPGREIEYDLLVDPGASTKAIRLRFEGMDSMGLDEAGDLVLRVDGGELRHRRPLAFQLLEGERREVRASFVVLGDHEIGFRVGAYDTRRPLVIDPALLYATHLGGAGNDTARAVATDVQGNAYVTGTTASAVFPPTTGAQDGSLGGARDAFVAKLNPAGSAVLYATYLGGAGNDDGYGIAVDAAGNAYITGSAEAGFPTTPGAFRTTVAGGTDAFVAKLDAAGSSLVYATFLGSADPDRGEAVAVDASGNAYVTGTLFGFMAPPFDVTPGAVQTTRVGMSDVFVTKLNPAGSALVFSTLLGGAVSNIGMIPTDGEVGKAIAVDAFGYVYVGGETHSVSFPATGGSHQETSFAVPCGPAMFEYPCAAGFVAKLNTRGSALVYSTFLAPSDGNARVEGLAVDAHGGAIVTGTTDHSGFPTTDGAFDRQCGSDGFCDFVPVVESVFRDVFVTRLNLNGSALAYSTFLGGAKDDEGLSIAIDDVGAAYVAGFTLSPDFPASPSAPQPQLNGTVADGFVAKLSPDASTLEHATYLGGTGDESSVAVAVDVAGRTLAAGTTASTNFPASTGSYQPASGGTGDATVAALATTKSAICDVEVPGRSYTTGDQIVMSRQRLANLSGSALTYELKRWQRPPRGALVVTQNVGSDGTASWPVGFDQDAGASVVAQVDASTVRGIWEIGCRVLDPASGQLLAEDLNYFEVR